MPLSTDIGEDNSGGSNRVNFADYLSAELDALMSYANWKTEICDSGPSNKDEGDAESARAPALAAVVESLNVVRSFVECSGGNSKLLNIVSQLEDVAYGAANYRCKQSRIDDYIK